MQPGFQVIALCDFFHASNFVAIWVLVVRPYLQALRCPEIPLLPQRQQARCHLIPEIDSSQLLQKPFQSLIHLCNAKVIYLYIIYLHISIMN